MNKMMPLLIKKYINDKTTFFMLQTRTSLTILQRKLYAMLCALFTALECVLNTLQYVLLAFIDGRRHTCIKTICICLLISVHLAPIFILVWFPSIILAYIDITNIILAYIVHTCLPIIHILGAIVIGATFANLIINITNESINFLYELPQYTINKAKSTAKKYISLVFLKKFFPDKQSFSGVIFDFIRIAIIEIVGVYVWFWLNPSIKTYGMENLHDFIEFIAQKFYYNNPYFITEITAVAFAAELILHVHKKESTQTQQSLLLSKLSNIIDYVFPPLSFTPLNENHHFFLIPHPHQLNIVHQPEIAAQPEELFSPFSRANGG